MNLRVTVFFSLLLFIFFCCPVYGQLGKISIDLTKEKPEKFKTQTLRSEKTGEKKFTLPRRFIQNTTSHYNYYFNAENKLNAVIERAKLNNQSDFTKLLPYYDFSLDDTKAQGNELDSVVSKATAGILLHDLRSDWVDDLYFLIGKAYYMKKDFDSAFMTFQFINYNLKPGKKADDNPIGTTGYTSGKGISIMSPEDKPAISKAFSRPPRRNDALVWQVRTLIEMGEFGEAAGLVNTLKNDPNLPERLATPLEEVEGYWFFKQGNFDSAIVHIENSLTNTSSKDELAHREFLLAQLYTLQDNPEAAVTCYNDAIKHTTDPLLDIYANLNKVLLFKSDDPAEITAGIDNLLAMARKDKFERYRDVIYFSAGELALQLPDTTSALQFFLGSTKYNEANLPFKNQAFLTLARLSYDQRDYRNAYKYYDSLQLPDSAISDINSILARKGALFQIVRHLNIIEREDSLLSVAALSPADRDAYLKRLSKQLKKERGVKENVEFVRGARNNQDSEELFAGNETKGDWYFYNNSVKSKGYNEFIRIWGKRENTDNWRRSGRGDAGRTIAQMNNVTGETDPLSPGIVTQEQTVGGFDDIGKYTQQDISVSALAANIPLTTEALDSSLSKIAVNLYQLGKNYQLLLEDYPAAIQTYETSLQRFPDSLYQGEIYSNLFFCYYKIGNTAMANQYKNRLLKNFPGSRYADQVLHPAKYAPAKHDSATTALYQDIYNQFIEGNFEKALKEKKAADSLYGQNYWTPQMLYIEAVYHIKNRQDSTANSILNELITRYAGSDMSDKATLMKEVLSRRDSIEHYLSNLEIERIKPEEEIFVFDDTKKTREVQTQKAANIPRAYEQNKVIPQVAEIKPELKLPAPVKKAGFTLDVAAPQNVVMLMTKVDPVYSSEARNAFIRYTRGSMSTNALKVTKDTLDKERSILIFSELVNMEEALKFLDKLRKDAPREVSWLPKDKYSFFIISDDNLELLKENKNLQDYINLLNSKFPEKF